jgi:putative membrane protein
VSEKHLLRGILAGAAGGLVAAWVMNKFIAGPGQKLQESLQSDEETQQQHQQQEQQEQSGEPKVDATMKAADAIVNVATGGEHLSMEGKQQGGPIVHYAFGAIMGGVYGGLAEYSSLARSGFGTSFGGVLFTGADLLAVPAFNLSPPLNKQPASALATPFAAHIVYGVTTELVRRIVRAIL